MMKNLLLVHNLSTAGGLQAFSFRDPGNGCPWCFHEESVIKFLSGSMRFITCPVDRNYFWVLKGLWNTLMTSAGRGGKPLNWTASPQCWRDILLAQARALSCLSAFGVLGQKEDQKRYVVEDTSRTARISAVGSSVTFVPFAPFSSSSLNLHLTFLSLPKNHCGRGHRTVDQSDFCSVCVVTISFPEFSVQLNTMLKCLKARAENTEGFYRNGYKGASCGCRL